MSNGTRPPLADYLALSYPFQVIADPEHGFLVRFPDLPGCFTQVDAVEDVGPMAEEIRILWIEGEYERNADIPLPTYPEEYSGKFNVRLPKSLHRQLAEAAEADGVSLNQYVVMLLTRGVTVDGSGRGGTTSRDGEANGSRQDEILMDARVQTEPWVETQG